MLAKILNLPNIKANGKVDGELMGSLQKKKKIFSLFVEVIS